MLVQSVNSTNNSKVNFGINIINKPNWNQGVLKALEKSQLVKDIDKKYPQAKIRYANQKLNGFDMVNDEPDYLGSLVIDLEKNKIFTFNINSHTSAGADNALKRYIHAVSLEEVEKRAKDKIEVPKYTIEIHPVKKQNLFARFFSKIWDKLSK